MSVIPSGKLTIHPILQGREISSYISLYLFKNGLFTLFIFCFTLLNFKSFYSIRGKKEGK